MEVAAAVSCNLRGRIGAASYCVGTYDVNGPQLLEPAHQSWGFPDSSHCSVCAWLHIRFMSGSSRSTWIRSSQPTRISLQHAVFFLYPFFCATRSAALGRAGVMVSPGRRCAIPHRPTVRNSTCTLVTASPCFDSLTPAHPVRQRWFSMRIRPISAFITAPMPGECPETPLTLRFPQHGNFRFVHSSHT